MEKPTRPERRMSVSRPKPQPTIDENEPTPGPSRPQPQLLEIPNSFQSPVEKSPATSRRSSLYAFSKSQLKQVKQGKNNNPITPNPQGKHKNTNADTSKQDIKIVVDTVDDLKKKWEADLRRSSGNIAFNPSINIPNCELLKVISTSPNVDIRKQTRKQSKPEEVIDGRGKSDLEILELLKTGQIPSYKLEDVCQDEARAVSIRRSFHCVENEKFQEALKGIPHKSYQYYSQVKGVCCENVIGFIPLTMFALGPLCINGTTFPVIPLATNDIKLMKTVFRGIKALTVNGVHSYVYGDGITRGPVVRLPTAGYAVALGDWLAVPDNFDIIQQSFEDTSRFLRLSEIKVRVAGKLCYLRFVARTGDAMGMNMISKGTLAALTTLKKYHPGMEVISVSGNYCIDKKPSALNWIEGRGKSVVSEAVVPAIFIEETLKTTAEAMTLVNHKVNLVGPTVSGTIGGFNTNAAGVVAAIFAATGQDVAQVVEGSHCMTVMECVGGRNEDLFISVTMPAVEVGAVGGGTVLPPQKSCLKLLGINGPSLESPGENARILSQVVAATVLAGELASVAALSRGSDSLIKSPFLNYPEQFDQDQELRLESDSDADLESEDDYDDEEKGNGRENEQGDDHVFKLRVVDTDHDSVTPGGSGVSSIEFEY